MPREPKLEVKIRAGQVRVLVAILQRNVKANNGHCNAGQLGSFHKTTCDAEDSHVPIADGNHGRQCQDSVPGQREIWGRRVALASGHHNKDRTLNPSGMMEKRPWVSIDQTRQRKHTSATPSTGDVFHESRLSSACFQSAVPSLETLLRRNFILCWVNGSPLAGRMTNTIPIFYSRCSGSPPFRNVIRAKRAGEFPETDCL
ncbi:hypothetical protein J3F84DRAFT_213482 [Trichoderma pleuroticola]